MAENEALQMSCRAMDKAVQKALDAVSNIEGLRPQKLGAAAPIMAEVYATAAKAVRGGGPTSGQLKAVEFAVEKLKGLRS